MNRRQSLLLLGGLALCPLCTRTGLAGEHADEHPHWSYEGEGGPERWAEIDAANKVCSLGLQQSPIDIVAATRSELPALKIAWNDRADTIANNGHTIQLNVGEGSTLAAPGGDYKLVQFHFHRPSEHLIEGKSYPMEVHFVHAGGPGLAVVGVLLATGKSNVAFKKIVSTMPREAGEPVAADGAIDPKGLLPPNRSYCRYQGSLTTPPCSETVDWLLLTDAVEVGKGRHRRIRGAVQVERPPGAKGQPSLRAAIELSGLRRAPMCAAPRIPGQAPG